MFEDGRLVALGPSRECGRGVAIQTTNFRSSIFLGTKRTRDESHSQQGVYLLWELLVPTDAPGEAPLAVEEPIESKAAKDTSA